ncbi:hypothetical protein HED60_05390 [Planctomycetales bacterium ZRK34]|nr:hypothetical protein HED60_05390 [Planctomycetales bacterium ZRK34]
MSNESIVKVLNCLESHDYRVTAMVNVEGIEIVAICPSGQTYHVKAAPNQRYAACCELARQLGVMVEPNQ